jgi:hypothetical protein
MHRADRNLWGWSHLRRGYSEWARHAEGTRGRVSQGHTARMDVIMSRLKSQSRSPSEMKPILHMSFLLDG